MDTISDFEEIGKLIEYPKSGILSKRIPNATKMNITLFCMTKESDIEDHTSTMQGTVHVLEGEGVFTLEGRAIEMKKGTLIFMKKNAVHSLKARTNLSFLLTLA